MVESITICATEDRQNWAWPHLGQFWVRWWLVVVGQSVSQSEDCLPLSLDRARIMGGGLIDLSTTGYHGVLRGHEPLIALSLF